MNSGHQGASPISRLQVPLPRLNIFLNGAGTTEVARGTTNSNQAIQRG